MAVFTCPDCHKIMKGVCPSCKAWYCDDCFNWHCDPGLFPPSGGNNGRATLGVFRILLLALVFVVLSGCLLSACRVGVDGPDAPLVSSSHDLSLTGSPSISVTFIDQVLRKYHSPAAGLGKTFSDLGVKYGIDPAFALAFFQHESGFGLHGVAVSSLSIGNIRCLPDVVCRDGFAFFPSWQAGIKAWYVLVAGPLYVGAGLTTVSQVVHRYAPSADHNDEVAYVQAVTQSVLAWRSGQD